MPHAPDALGLALDALRELISAGEQYRAALVSGFDVTTAETAAVGFLYHRGELSQTELAGHMGMSTSSVTAVIDRLEHGGYAKRRTNPRDRRRNVIALTDKAVAAILEARDGLGGAFDEIDPADLARTTEVLRIVADGIARRTAAFPVADVG